jgi:hypothetical protein
MSQKAGDFWLGGQILGSDVCAAIQVGHMTGALDMYPCLRGQETAVGYAGRR